MEEPTPYVPGYLKYVSIVDPSTGPISSDNPIPVTFGSGSINVTAEVTNTQLEISNDIGNPIPVTISGSLGEISSSITNFPEFQQITGSVVVSNLPITQSVIVTNFPSSSTQEVTGSINVLNFPIIQEVTGSVTISNPTTGSSTEAKQDITNNILNITTGSLSSIDKNTTAFYTEDIEEDTSNSTTFVGKQTNTGIWLIQKIIDTAVGTVTTTTMEYASVLNNATKTTYASAWTDRATLTYSEIKDLL